VGGPDNVTVVLARFAGEGLAAPGSDEDLPRFIEFDPMEEGERAITTTSRVARRLAARAGMGDDTPVKALPPTGQHTALTDADAKVLRRRPAAPGKRTGATTHPAEDALARRSRLGTGVFILAALAAVAIGALVMLRC